MGNIYHCIQHTDTAVRYCVGTINGGLVASSVSLDVCQNCGIYRKMYCEVTPQKNLLLVIALTT